MSKEKELKQFPRLESDEDAERLWKDDHKRFSVSSYVFCAKR